MKKERAIPVRCCVLCYSVMPAARKCCPHCGHEKGGPWPPVAAVDPKKVERDKSRTQKGR